MKTFAASRAMLLALSLLFVFALPLHAATPVAVGTCRPTMPSYPTIQAAVNAVSPGGMVYVCAANYPEQVTIQQPMTLTGVPVGRMQAPVISPPLAGYTTFYERQTGSPTIFSLLAQNAGTVAINNFVIQGNSTCPAPDDAAGVASQDSTTTLTNSVVRSIGTRDSCGTAVYSEGAGNLNLVNDSLHDFYAGIVSYSSQALNISSTTLSNGGTGMDLELSSGLVTVTGNSMQSIGCPLCSGGGPGILITGLPAGSKITNNSIGMLSGGGGALVLYNSSQLTVTGNKTNGGSYGVIAWGLNSSMLESNTIVNSGVAIRITDNGAGNNSFLKNTIKETNCGIWTVSSSGDTVSGNIFSNALATTCP